MSDLISTPSQTPSAVSSEAFEALVDLLTSDGIDEYPSKKPANTHSLRDPSGKLDFDKIRLMFAVQNGTHPQEPLREEKGQAQSSVTPHEDGESDDEHSHQSTSTVPSRSNSMSPKPITRAAAGHRRSSTFGNQPWLSTHENATIAKENQPSTSSSHQHLSFEELNAALAGAHEEVMSLRQQYDRLRALVSKRLGTETRDQAKFIQASVNNERAPMKENGHHAETRAAGSQAISASPLSNLPVEIANLSEEEAKRALDALVGSLNLSPSSLASLSTTATPTSPKQYLFPPNPMRQHDVASITRALKFLGTVDELVWRRVTTPSGPRTLSPVFSEENIVALVSRLELWERAVRRSTRV